MTPGQRGALQGLMSTSLPAVRWAKTQFSRAHVKHLHAKRAVRVLILQKEAKQKNVDDNPYLKSDWPSRPSGGGGGSLSQKDKYD